MNTFSIAGLGIKSVATVVAVLGFLATVGGPVTLAEHYARTGGEPELQVRMAQSDVATGWTHQADKSALDNGGDLNRQLEPTAAGPRAGQ